MPPKKKKQAKNAFYYFLVEFREEALRSGRNIDSPAFEEEADREWRNLSPESRYHYEEIAMEKRKKMDSLENKFTTTGVSYAQLQREEMERLRQEEMMKHEIESTVRSLTGNTLKTKVFHFIHVNTYCRLLDGHYLPCEIGIAKFTFENGVKDCYHTIINLECIPTGYLLECQKNSEETHQIPLPPENTLGEWDSEKVLVQIEAFLAENGIYPPVYTLQSNIEAAQDTLTTFASGKDTFRVYPIAKLLFELRNACANEASGVGFPVLSLAEREFEKDFFNLSPGISCFYHEGMDACQYCSLSIVKRWCFLFASLGCPDLGIALKPGSHKPRKITLPPAPPEPMTSKTQVSLRKGKKGAPTVEPPPITIIDYSSKSIDYLDGGTKSDSPLAQFGTYIRATADEIGPETNHLETSQMSSYSMHYNDATSIADHNFLQYPIHTTERKNIFEREDNIAFTPKKSKQHFSIGRDNEDGPAVDTIMRDEEEKQFHPSYFQPASYEEFPRDNLKIKELQKPQTSELYSQFAFDVHDSLSQNIELSSQEPQDVFDIYVDSMFQPVPVQGQSPDRSQAIKNIENCPTPPWKNSFPSPIKKEVISSSPHRNRNQSPIFGTDISIGHGRGISKEPVTSNFSPTRPGRENLYTGRTTSPQMRTWELEEQEALKNGNTPLVRLPGRGRGRARNISLQME